MEPESPHLLPKDQKFAQLSSEEAFRGLTGQMKRYAHHLSKASWYGGLIILHQTSPEAPLIFAALHRAFASQPMDQLETAVENAGISQEDFQAIKTYACGVYTNMGNYKGFGDIKIIPRVSESTMEAFFRATVAYQKDPDGMDKLWALIREPMFSLQEGTQYLGFHGKGVTTYFSKNCTQEDSDLVNKFMSKNKIGMCNHRVFKTVENGKPTYELRMAGVKTEPMGNSFDEEFEGARFRVTRGDYSPVMKLVNAELMKAVEYAANDLERKMLLKYVESFEEGSLDAHIEGSRFWVKDKGPDVEMYIGFIETYRDPGGVRGEFEGIVAMVNKELSKRFASLVNNAEKFLAEMPWPKEFEGDVFLRPDFTSLDILTYASSMLFSGICIPNYPDLKLTDGFKNVSLGNVIVANQPSKTEDVPFLSAEDSARLTQYGSASIEIEVALHELLGHGSGKMFMKDSNGQLNFATEVVNPLTGEKVSSWYEPGETYSSKFGRIGNAYEECRAELACLQLCHIPEIMDIFGHTGKEAEEIRKTIWLGMTYNGFAKSLNDYDPSTKTWLQAHSRARFAILRVLLAAGGGFVTIEEKTVSESSDGNPDLLLKVDYSKVDTVGRPAVADFLLKLQVFRSCGDADSGKKLFEAFSEVPEDSPYPFGKWRNLILAKKKPRKLIFCPNTYLEGEEVLLKNYEESANGCIQSYLDRLPVDSDPDVTRIVYDLWKKDADHFS